MAQAQVAEALVPLENFIDTKILKEKLRFRFQGYAIWLEIEQFPASDSNDKGIQVPQKNDLECAIQTASKELGVYPIPSPHLTALYGINHLAETEVRNRFQDLSRQLRNGDMDWPLLEPLGFLSDVEFEGIDGGEMNMAWMEVTFTTSLEHENCLDQVFQCFYNNTGNTRSGPWCPHLSLAYDNEDSPISHEYLEHLLKRFPTLALPRRVESLSLWNLNGTIDQWSLVDRIALKAASSVDGFGTNKDS